MGTFRVRIKSKLMSELKSELKLSNMYAYGKLISLQLVQNLFQTKLRLTRDIL